MIDEMKLNERRIWSLRLSKGEFVIPTRPEPFVTFMSLKKALKKARFEDTIN
jgi:hypothetical protein